MGNWQTLSFMNSRLDSVNVYGGSRKYLSTLTAISSLWFGQEVLAFLSGGSEQITSTNWQSTPKCDFHLVGIVGIIPENHEWRKSCRSTHLLNSD